MEKHPERVLFSILNLLFAVLSAKKSLACMPANLSVRGEFFFAG